jgi:hypothetical protein
MPISVWLLVTEFSNTSRADWAVVLRLKICWNKSSFKLPPARITYSLSLFLSLLLFEFRNNTHCAPSVENIDWINDHLTLVWGWTLWSLFPVTFHSFDNWATKWTSFTYLLHVNDCKPLHFFHLFLLHIWQTTSNSVENSIYAYNYL